MKTNLLANEPQTIDQENSEAIDVAAFQFLFGASTEKTSVEEETPSILDPITGLETNSIVVGEEALSLAIQNFIQDELSSNDAITFSERAFNGIVSQVTDFPGEQDVPDEWLTLGSDFSLGEIGIEPQSSSVQNPLSTEITGTTIFSVFDGITNNIQ
ncbi:hypothetical protein [Acaryochloris thomasi]|nr:hypothetical protein [Acaryochloris thomasi]